MIRYTLACESGHEFESWFRDSSAFDAQAAAGFVTCPVCGSAKVAKTIMAPALARSEARAPSHSEPAQGERAQAERETGEREGGGGAASVPAGMPAESGQVMLLGEKEAQLREALRQLRKHIEANSDDVGARFPEEARRMQTGEIEHRSIRGEADPEEVRSLLDEGIDVYALPVLPDDRN